MATLMEQLKITGVSKSSYFHYLSKGLSHEEAISKPSKSVSKYTNSEL